MSRQFLDFEQPIAEIEAKIAELRLLGSDSEINILDEIQRLEKKAQGLARSIFSALTPWQITQMARHPLRPHTSDYIQRLFTDFEEMEGDRHFSEGPSIIGGLARFQDTPVVVMGHEKGQKTKEKLHRNFGMPRPEDYRKALRLMELAEKFSLPIFTFIDTPGAYPGIDAEERNQSEAIARNLLRLSQLRVPILCTVIGEGGSGGALAIGLGNAVFMLQYSIYSVISPEGCASILWRSADKASDAASAMGVTADRSLALGLIDAIIEEPIGGAHRCLDTMVARMQQVYTKSLAQWHAMTPEQRMHQRREKFLKMGRPQ